MVVYKKKKVSALSEIKLCNVMVNYEEVGSGQDVILLHGWGQNIEMMEPLQKVLKEDNHVHVLDFPGFGASELPNTVWGVNDYAVMLEEYVKEKNIINPIIIAHSFGARVALIYASRNDVKNLILTGAAGIRPKRGFKYYYKTYTYKLAKRFLSLPYFKQYKDQLLKTAGSSDYQNTSGVLRGIFVKVVNEDLTKYLDKIKARTLLIWGETDTATPLWMGKVMEDKIPNATLVVFKGIGHYAYYYRANEFLMAVDAFVKEGEIHG